MTADEFVALVVRMRDAQKAYFRARRSGRDGWDELRLSRDLERQVDQAADAWGKPPEPTLFPEPTDG